MKILLVNGRSIRLLPSFLRGTYLLFVIFLKVFSCNEYTNNCDSFKFSSREHFLIIFSLKSDKIEKIHYKVIFGRIGLQKNHQLVDHACISIFSGFRHRPFFPTKNSFKGTIIGKNNCLNNNETRKIVKF
jgi:hypothetical protein